MYIYRQEALDTFKEKGTFTWKLQCGAGSKARARKLTAAIYMGYLSMICE